MRAEARTIVSPKLLIGVFLMLAGIFTMLDSLDLMEARVVLRYWPAALFALGAMLFLQAREGDSRVGGVVMMAIGAWLFLDVLSLVRVSFWQLFWPAALLLIGASLIRDTLQGGGAGRTPDASETVSLVAVMGGLGRTSNSPRFAGGQMIGFMGGCELDLRMANIPPGEQATLDVLALMGGHEIHVPAHWSVVVHALPFMGGIDDNTTPPADPQSPRLVVRGLIMMGGLEIKN